MKNKQQTNDLAAFQFVAETGDLMRMPRSHNRFLGNTFDTVASHAHHVALISYTLTRLEGLTHEQGLQAIAMGILHDNAEVRTGDLNFVEKHYAKTDEEQALKHQLQDLPFGEDLHKIIAAYEARDTLEARCVKDADALEQMYQEWVLAYMGNREAQRWLEGNKENRIPKLRTESAKRLALLFYQHTPSDWWSKNMEGENLNRELLNGKR